MSKTKIEPRTKRKCQKWAIKSVKKIKIYDKEKKRENNERRKKERVKKMLENEKRENIKFELPWKKIYQKSELQEKETGLIN